MKKASPPNDRDDFGVFTPYDAQEAWDEVLAMRRAKTVFDALEDLPDPDLEDPEGSEKRYQDYLRRLDFAIKENLDGSSIWQFVWLAGEKRASWQGKSRVWQKLEKDPKQAEKVLVRECWELWRNEPKRYKGKAEFARDMLAKFEHLKSQQVIERWCRDWEAEANQSGT